MASIAYSDGSALVPQPVANEIVKSITQNSAAMRLFKVQTMPYGSVKVPVMASLADAYWVAEGGTKQTTSVTWTSQTILAEELAVIVPVADNLLRDSAFDIWGEVKQSIAEKFALKLDAAVFFGTDAPSSYPNSLAEGAIAAGNVYNVGSNTAAQGGVAQDVLNTMKKVYEQGYRVNGYAAADLFNFDLLSARDANGNPLLGANASIDTLYGHPIAYVGGAVFGNSAGDPVLIAGDFDKAILGMTQEIEFTFSKDATLGDGTNLFLTDRTAIRATMRVGFTVLKPVNRVGSNGYPFAVLRKAPAGSSGSSTSSSSA